jgi:hypothetical protein
MTLTLHLDGTTRRVPLAATTLVGRHWSCGVHVPCARLPSFWLELRWTEEGWRWRELAGDGTTQSAGPVLGGGWRALTSRVRWDANLWVALDQDAPPVPALVDLVGGEWLTGEPLDAWLEEAEGARWVPAGEGPPTHRLVDGEVVVLQGRTWRYLAGVPATATRTEAFHVQHRDVRIDIDLPRLEATVRCGRHAVLVHGECVRVLAVYVEARARGDGWLTRTEAWDAWVALGGNPASAPERLGWERGKLRTQLARQGVLGVQDLFETRSEERVWELRLAVK